jgi:hypothetical protein
MFRISLLLWLIALVAVNLTLLRYSEAVIELSPKFAGLIGLMPLFDLFVLSLYRIVIRLHRQTDILMPHEALPHSRRHAGHAQHGPRTHTKTVKIRGPSLTII